MTVPQRVIERIKARVVVDESGCWLWSRSLINGYGQIGWVEGGKPGRSLTHRAMYEAQVGSIPDALFIDHLCHNPSTCRPAVASDCPHRRCCNPAHLKPATTRENVLRGGGFTADNAAKTECPQGHRYDDANTYVAPDGARQCRTCRTEQVRATRARRANQ